MKVASTVAGSALFDIIAISPDEVVIRDTGHDRGRMSVTNDAESVVSRLRGLCVLRPGRRLFYYDSEGELDEILIQDGRFAGFVPGAARV